MFGAFGANINGLIIICGGNNFTNGRTEFTSNCYKYINDQFVYFTTLKYPRSYATMTKINDSLLWISGGNERPKPQF